MARVYRREKSLEIKIETDDWLIDITRDKKKNGNYDVWLTISQKECDPNEIIGELRYANITRETWLSLKKYYKRKRAIDKLAAK